MATQSELLSKAPEGATHFQSYNGKFTYYKYCGDVFYYYQYMSQWHPSSLSPINLTALPQPIKENWFENGILPPVGTECEWSCNGVSFELCTILIYHANTVVLYHTKYPANVRILKTEEITFRPLKSDREKAIEAALDNCTFFEVEDDIVATYRRAFEQAYDAGLLRLSRDE